jgi:DNA (cytosine-5)-methyltransferase 1
MPTVEQRRARRVKIDRLRAGDAPRVLELCSGCGGLSLGLKRVGFQLTAHVEKDEEAARSYALNFSAGSPGSSKWAATRDMEAVSASELVRDLSLDTPTPESFDIVAAGLPCQAFARIGRSKLRAVAGKEDAFRRDARAVLYRRFLDYVSDTQPLVIIVENVPDILNFGGHNIPEEICETLEAAGYITAYTLLNAAYFGVPQVRERFFLVAFADELQVKPRFPEPARYLDLPRGYEGSRRVALKHVPVNSTRFVPVQTPSPDLRFAVGAEEALGDLPVIHEHWTEPRIMRRRRVTDRLPYRQTERLSDFARDMRNWPGFPNSSDSDGHVVRLTPRDFPIFEAMPSGADYPQARRIAEEMFIAEAERQGLADCDPRSPELLALRQERVPPYDPNKFPNKWWKLDPLKPSRTLTAHMGKDTYSHIHYDSTQRRTVSVREAARLQSFPDAFRFAGAMNAAFRQIGNAVPPLLALAVARSIQDQLVSALDQANVDHRRQVA